MEGSSNNGPASNQDDVPSRSNTIHAQPDDLAHQTTGPVATYSIADTPTGGKAKAAVRQAVGPIKQYSQGMFATLAALADLLKRLPRA